ncbi:MAG TPA: hypothetical protein VFF28_08000 [Candidatus Nanoarchaeia archaeon]|nr:hypothetical protein [Candidatus Nanoarchaeia archaeon]
MADSLQQKHSMFKSQGPEQPAPISSELEGMISRLRVLEERYTNIQTELRVTEENMISRNKKLAAEIKALTSENTELKKEINEIKEKVLLVIKELQGFAKKEDLRVLQRYIEMWEPLNFVTHKEVADVIEEKLAEKR